MYSFIVFVCFPSIIRTPFTIAVLKLIGDATIIDVALRGSIIMKLVMPLLSNSVAQTVGIVPVEVLSGMDTDLYRQLHKRKVVS